MENQTDFQIDKYILMTMPRSIKRQWYALGNATAMGVPFDRIRFFPGHDAEDYDMNMTRIADAAADDGYPFLRQFAIGFKGAHIQQSAGNVALFWNWARLLDWISNCDELCIVLWDDRMLKVPFMLLENVVAELYTRPEDFLIFQLRLRSNFAHLNAVGKDNFKVTDDLQAENEFFETSIHARIPSYFSAYLDKGLLGWDESMVISPWGAEWLLQQMHDMEDITELLKDFQFDEQPHHMISAENLQPLQRSRLNNDNWLWHGTQDAVKQALRNNKGLYHPRRIGYAFAAEPLDLGSNVHWNIDAEWNVDPKAHIRFL